VGHLLKYEAPLEFKLIVDSAGLEPSADFIEAVSYASTNPLFRKTKFRRCLIDYRKHGLDSVIPVKDDVRVELYYIRLRRNAVREEKRGGA
jgi:hypothetical protein